MGQHYQRSPKGEAVFDDARRWEGWGTALKPAHEPICLARKPLSEDTIAENVLRWATGAMNVEATRVGNERLSAQAMGQPLIGTFKHNGIVTPEREGRWPANVLHDGSAEVVAAFPPSARDRVRFFYSPKAQPGERDEGLDALPVVPSHEITGRVEGAAGAVNARSGATGDRRNFHPTVKPVDLMRWLVRLLTPPRGLVLDPFMGSGTTGVAALREGFRFVGVEQSPEYFALCCARIQAAHERIEREPDLVRQITAVTRRLARHHAQPALFEMPLHQPAEALA